MDLTIDIKDKRLNIRTTGIIIHNNKVLVHKDLNEGHICLPGGRVILGEDSECSIKREMEEEIGKEIEIEKYLTTIENFFDMDGQKCHEIMFVYKIEFKNEEDKKIEHTLKNIEGKDYLCYEWIDISRIEKYNIQPKCLKELLKENKFPRHKINKDI